jgi:hypothetical protein
MWSEVFHFPNFFVHVLLGYGGMNELPLLTLIVVNIKIDVTKNMSKIFTQHMVIVVEALDCCSGK